MIEPELDELVFSTPKPDPDPEELAEFRRTQAIDILDLKCGSDDQLRLRLGWIKPENMVSELERVLDARLKAALVVQDLGNKATIISTRLRAFHEDVQEVQNKLKTPADQVASLLAQVEQEVLPLVSQLDLPPKIRKVLSVAGRLGTFTPEDLFKRLDGEISLSYIYNALKTLSWKNLIKKEGRKYKAIVSEGGSNGK